MCALCMFEGIFSLDAVKLYRTSDDEYLTFYPFMICNGLLHLYIWIIFFVYIVKGRLTKSTDRTVNNVHPD